MHACMLSHVQFFVTPRTVAHQAPLPMGFSRQEYWSGLPFPPPGNLPNPGIKPKSPASPALAGRFFPPEPPRKPIISKTNSKCSTSAKPLSSCQMVCGNLCQGVVLYIHQKWSFGDCFGFEISYLYYLQEYTAWKSLMQQPES